MDYRNKYRQVLTRLLPSVYDMEMQSEGGTKYYVGIKSRASRFHGISREAHTKTVAVLGPFLLPEVRRTIQGSIIKTVKEN